MGSILTTRMSSFRTLDTLTDASSAVDSDLAAASGFTISVPDGATDLKVDAGAGYESYANGVVLILNAQGAADGDTLTQKIYGIAEGGAPQLICSIVWTIGTARVVAATADHLWADTAVVTDTHITTVGTGDDSGNNRISCVSFDCTGFRYLYSLITAQTGDPTLVTSLYRYY